jgi:hypothetical protein
MSTEFDQPESTWVYDYTGKTAELYTTDRRLWLRALARNPNFAKARDLKPGYIAVWPISEIRTPDAVVKPKNGGQEAAKQYMTPQEIANREATGKRLRESQGKD